MWKASQSKSLFTISLWCLLIETYISTPPTRTVPFKLKVQRLVTLQLNSFQTGFSHSISNYNHYNVCRPMAWSDHTTHVYAVCVYVCVCLWMVCAVFLAASRGCEILLEVSWVVFVSWPLCWGTEGRQGGQVNGIWGLAGNIKLHLHNKWQSAFVCHGPWWQLQWAADRE